MQLTRWLVFSIAAALLVLAACSDDDSDWQYDLLAPLAGEWSGEWNNETSDSSAPISMTIVVNIDGTASFSFDLPDGPNGAPFGGETISSRTFEGTYDDAGISIIVRGDEIFGDVNVTISLQGNIIAEATMDGVPGVIALTARGSFDGSKLDITYTVRFSPDSGARGSATLTKQ